MVFKRNIGAMIKTMPRRYLGSLLIVSGALLVLCCMLLLVQPFYTLAQEVDDEHPCRFTVSPDVLFEVGNMNPGDSIKRTLTVTKLGTVAAYIWMSHQWVDGDPLPGELGDLYGQLVITVTWQGKLLYRGPLDGLLEPINISALIGPIRPGQQIDLDFNIVLPGPETGNEFQGSSLKTRFVFYSQCAGEVEVPPEEPGTDPDPDPDPDPLPATGGLLPVSLVLIGFMLVLAGLYIKWRAGREENSPGRV